MNKKNALQYIIVVAAFCIPSPARLGYGFILIFAYNFLTLVLATVKYLLVKSNLDTYSKILQLILAIAFTVLCRQLITLYSPLHALVLGNILYIIPVSSFISGIIATECAPSFLLDIKKFMAHSAFVSLFALIFYIVREYFSFGTLSFPSHDGMFLLNVPKLNILGSGYFWASIPGALVLFALFILLISVISKHHEIKWRSENTNV